MAQQQEDKFTRHTKHQIYKIAARHIPALSERGDLEVHGSDGEDFFETSVWDISAALEAAYKLGQKNHKNNLTLEDINLINSYILMTTKYRQRERETWKELSDDLNAEKEPLFKYAAENAEYWADLDKKLWAIKEKLDRMY